MNDEPTLVYVVLYDFHGFLHGVFTSKARAIEVARGIENSWVEERVLDNPGIEEKSVWLSGYDDEDNDEEDES